MDVFTRNEYKEEMIKYWQHCQGKKGLEIYAWCIMPSHVHMLIRSVGRHCTGREKLYFNLVKKADKEHGQESRPEWIMWMMERAGKRNGNNRD